MAASDEAESLRGASASLAGGVLTQADWGAQCRGSNLIRLANRGVWPMHLRGASPRRAGRTRGTGCPLRNHRRFTGKRHA